MILLMGVVTIVLLCADMADLIMTSFFVYFRPSTLLFGLAMPFISQFLMLMVKDYRKYTLGTVIEVCEFGFPFTVILSVLFLCATMGLGGEQAIAMDGAYEAVSNNTMHWLMNYTTYEMIEANQSLILFHVISPLLLVPTIVLYTSCILVGKAIDPILSLGASLAIDKLLYMDSTSSPIPYYALAVVILGMLVRVLGEYKLPDPVTYMMHGGQVQLNSRVLQEIPEIGTEPEGEAWT